MTVCNNWALPQLRTWYYYLVVGNLEDIAEASSTDVICYFIRDLKWVFEWSSSYCSDVWAETRRMAGLVLCNKVISDGFWIDVCTSESTKLNSLFIQMKNLYVFVESYNTNKVLLWGKAFRSPTLVSSRNDCISNVLPWCRKAWPEGVLFTHMSAACTTVPWT